MKLKELNPYSFRSLHHQLGHDRPQDPRPMWQQRLSAESDFCRAMVSSGYLTKEQMQRAALHYRLGRSRDGGVIFWQIDAIGLVYDGKIMHYRPDGHRDHNRNPYWVSSALKRHYLKDNEQLASGMSSYHCLFGTHLLGEESQLPVAVVEAEKTAVVMSEYYPDYLWLAAGGLYELTAAKLFPLRGRRIILFPDTDPKGEAFSTWYRVTLEAQRLLGQTIHLSPLLEQRSTPSQKQRKIDILDYMTEDDFFRQNDIRAEDYESNVKIRIGTGSRCER